MATVDADGTLQAIRSAVKRGSMFTRERLFVIQLTMAHANVLQD